MPNETDNCEIRKSILQDLRCLNLLGIGSNMYEATFSGYGDSGDLHDISPNFSTEDENLFERLEKYFYSIVEKHVHWDWYNNEGGGGIVTWDILSDKITVGGYCNVVERIDQGEVEF